MIYQDFTLNDYLKTIHYRITDGSEFLWDCFGDKAYCYTHLKYSSWGCECEFNVVFDTLDTLVYMLEFYDYHSDTSYRWIHPEYKEEYDAEAIRRNELVDPGMVDLSNNFDEFKTILTQLSERFEA